MPLRTDVMVELHYKDCACRGTGWLSYPGIGKRALTCQAKKVILLRRPLWEGIGKPATAEEALASGGVA